MDISSGLTAVAGISFLGALSPGPTFFVIVKNSLCGSKTVGFATVIGVALALLIHLFYTVIGLNFLLEKYPSLYLLLRYAGAAYLFCLGCKMFLTSFTHKTYVAASSRSLTMGAAFRQGFLVNLLNPKNAVFFISFFSQLMTPIPHSPCGSAMPL